MKILVMNFFPAFVPPQSGGELRYFNMYRNLSNYYDVTLLSPTYREHKYEVVVHSDTFREYRVPKEEIHDILHKNIADENICPEISALVCYETAKYHNQYHDIYQKLYKEADIIIHEFPYMINYDLYMGLDEKIRIYNSHNFESELVRQMWKGPNADKYLSRIRDAEKRLVQSADLVFATSEEEREAFINVLGGKREKIHLAPNGIDTGLYDRSLKKNTGNRKKAFFIGSAHPPNMEAVQLIIDTVAPECPDIDFYIAGKCCNGFENKDNVHLLGLINEAQKENLFISSDIAINPMFSGAGTNLKTLEFLSAGIPLLSTAVGVRGLGLEDKVHFLHAEKADFAETLKNALMDDTRLQSIAKKGQEFIDKNYSWKSICNNVYSEIEKIIAAEKEKTPIRKKLLFLNDFEINHPVSGGEVRCFNIISGLSKWYDVVYICLNNDNQLRREEMNNHFTYISLPKTKEHIEETVRINSKHWISADDIVTSYMIEKNELVINTIRVLVQLSDVIVLEHPYMARTLSNISGKKIIYESHNFETVLKTEVLKEHPLKDFLIKAVRNVEKEALKKCDLLVGVTEDELIKMQEFSGRDDIWTLKIENGVTVPVEKYNYEALKEYLGHRRMITFVGSGHAPNVAAAKFIVDVLAPQFPNEIFAIIGSVCTAISGDVKTNNVLLFGKISEERKHFLLFSSDIALNPMSGGAGSNLKLAEYFAYKIPTLTTPTGIRGFNAKNQSEAIVAELDMFPSELNNMLNGRYDLAQMREHAYEYIQREVSWDVLTQKYSEGIENYLYKKKLLVYTYRYNWPPRGGAEVYLTKVLSYMAARGNYMIDIVTTNIGDINEQFRFSNTYTEDSDCDSNIPGVYVHKFPVENLDVATRWKYCNELYVQFNKESHVLADKFQDFYPHALLMGGWYYPEPNGDNGYQCWSSDFSKICVNGLENLKIIGYAPKRAKISIYVDGRMISESTKYHGFEIQIPLNKNQTVGLQSSTFVVENQDPRVLGVLVYKIVGTTNQIEKELDFTNDYKNYLRQNMLNELIDSYIALACKRPLELNHKFYNVRGPVSSSLREWAKKNIEKYDVIFGHSVPFNTLIAAQEDAAAFSKPILTLPHFHMEDDFYHWKLYYDALSGASNTLCFPKAAKDIFFDKIGAKTVFVPGGGIDIAEFENIDDSGIGEILKDNRPYIVVLGRKTGAKNYSWVIDAVDFLNKQNVNIHLVIIGKDEDKKPITSSNVTYLGTQPRENVLAVLKHCEFVVNMSESESFGIVIVEAWMAHKAVIVNEKCRAFTELVENGINGLYASRENLPEKIKSLLEQDKEPMAQNGYEKARNEYTWEQISLKIETTLDSLLQK